MIHYDNIEKLCNVIMHVKKNDSFNIVRYTGIQLQTYFLNVMAP